MKVLGSSFPGGLLLISASISIPGSRAADALEALENFAWDELKCLHLEVSDPHFTFDDGEGSGFKAGVLRFLSDGPDASEEELFNGMDSACRRCIRKAEKSGLNIEEAHDLGVRGRILRATERCLCQAVPGADLFSGTRSFAGSQRWRRAAMCC